MADLPRLAGISKEAVAFAVGTLEQRGLAVVGSDPADGRSRLLELTASGREAREMCAPLLEESERRLGERFGDERIAALRSALERLVAHPDWACRSRPGHVALPHRRAVRAARLSDGAAPRRLPGRQLMGTPEDSRMKRARAWRSASHAAVCDV